jgi:hypothetical protein
MKNDVFVEPRLGFTMTKPVTWQFVPPQWSPSQQLDPARDLDEQWNNCSHLAFCGAVRPHASRRHAFATMQVTARPLTPPGDAEAAAMLQTVQGILQNQNPHAEVLVATSAGVIGGVRANVLRCRFALPIEVAQERVMMGVISRSYVIFGPRYAFTLGLSSSDDPAFYVESEFADIVASVRVT